MANAFQVTNQGNHRKSGFDAHSFIPGALLAEFDVFRDTIFISEAEVGQDNGLVDKGLHNRMEMLVVHIDRGPVPGNNSASLVEQPTKLDTNAPATFVSSLLANLFLAAPFPFTRLMPSRASSRLGAMTAVNLFTKLM